MMNFRVLLPLLALCVVCASCKHEPKIEKIQVELVAITPAAIEVQNPMGELIKQYKNNKDEIMEVTIGYSDILMKVEQPEGLLNNLVADILLDFANKSIPTDFAVNNNGGIRRDLYEGVITLGDIFEILPFDNTLVVLELNGEQVEELAHIIAEKNGASTSGISMGIKNGKATNILIQGKPLEKERTYRIVTNDYLSYGNDYFTVLKEGVNRHEFPDKMRDVAISYIIKKTTANEHITSTLKHEIYVEK